MATISKDQRAHLLQRVAERYSVLRNTTPAYKEPAAVTKARQLVREHDTAQGDVRAARSLRLGQAHLHAKEAIEFAATPEAALAAVKAFETLKV